MDQGTVFNIVFAAIASVGGAGAIVTACVRFASKHLSEAMLKRYQANLEKGIEQYKSELNCEAERYRYCPDSCANSSRRLLTIGMVTRPAA